MRTARSIQASILPHSVPALDRLDIAVRYLPMGSVAGDLYDFSTSDPDRVGVLVADVTGHGVPAALIASMAKVAFTSQTENAHQPGDLLAGMNRALCGHVEARFVTAGYAYTDTTTMQLSYASAGHPPALLWQRSTGVIVGLADGGVLMGFDPEAQYPTTTTAVEPGDRLVLYTDGVVESTNQEGEFFGEDGLRSFIGGGGDLSPEQFLDALLERLLHWSGRGNSDDDLTVLVVDVG